MRTIFIFVQISFCLASSGPKITVESDQEIIDPFIDNFQPTMTRLSSVVAISSPSSTATPRATETPRPTTIIWSWWRMTNNARRESIGLKPASSIPTSHPRFMPSSSPIPSKLTVKPPTVTVTQPPIVTVTSIQPSAVTVTATSTVTNGPVEASTKSKSQLHQEHVKQELKTLKKLSIFMQILAGFVG